MFLSGLILASDGLNYWSVGGRTFNIDASYVALSCVSSSLLRRLRSWMLVVVGGAKGRWEENMLPLINTIRQLEKGVPRESEDWRRGRTNGEFMRSVIRFSSRTGVSS